MAISDKKSLLTEDGSTSKNQLITDARSNAIDNAHKALVDAFGPKLEERVTETDLNELIQELENAPEDDDMVKECRKRLNEAKDPSVPTNEKERMYRDIHRKFWAYVQSLPNRDWAKETRKLTEADQAEKKFRENKSGPIQWISYEGSMILCSLVSVTDDGNAFINMSQLPKEDQDIVFHMTGKKVLNGFRAAFDDYKNFDCYIGDNVDKESSSTRFTLGNRVASIPPHESSRFGNVDVKVERKGKDILIGDRIKIERNKLQNLASPTDPTNNGANRGLGFQPRQKVSGRNAYEIRADVLEMALDFAKTQGDKKLDSDDVLDIAEAFYGFVEHK